MNTFIDQFGNLALLPIYSVLLVAIFEWRINIPEKIHPLTFARLMANQLAYKVSLRKPGNALQQRIAGTLAPIVLILPVISLLGILIFLSEFPIFFDSLLLLVALRFEPAVIIVQKIEHALRRDKKTLAKHQLQTIILRKTEQLSPFGIAKAAIETALLRFALQYCTVIILYLTFGGLVALTYRLLLECAYCWNTKVPQFRYFGQPLRYFLLAIQWIPAWIASLAFIIGQNIIKGTGAIGSISHPFCSRLVILHLQGTALDVELGGPAYYSQNKSRLLKCGGRRKVVLDDMHRTISAIRRAQWVFLSICFISQLLLNVRY